MKKEWTGYHRHKEWGSAGSYKGHDEIGDPIDTNISRLTFNFNIRPMIALGAELRLSSKAIDYNLTIGCFNVNGYLVYVKKFQ